MEKTATNTLIFRTWKTKTIAAVLAVLGAVAIPQIFHVLGMITDMGSAFGAVFLPMHFTIFLVGYFAGAWAGLGAGLAAPALSFALTAAMGDPMPSLVSLPYMVLELGVYGLTTGLFAERARRKLPTILTLLVAQIAGRAIRALAIAVGVFLLGSPIQISTIWVSIYEGLPGLILQWIIIPLAVAYVAERSHRGR